MKRYISILVCILSGLTLSAQSIDTKVTSSGGRVRLENSRISVDVDLGSAAYHVVDKTAGLTVLKDAAISPDGWNQGSRHTRFEGNVEVKWSQRPVESRGKKGTRLELSLLNTKRAFLPTYLFAFTLYDDASWIEFQTGMDNTSGRSCRIMSVYPFFKASLLPLQHLSDVKTLNGAAGYEPTAVKGNESRTSNNSLLLTARVNGERYSMVWGGLDYGEFYATSFYDAEKRTVSLKMSDPTGKLVPEGTSYWVPDTYYLGIGQTDPFEEAEKYGLLLRAANNAHPKIYNFVKLCGWAVGALSRQQDVNNSVDLVEEMDFANRCGLTKYVKVGIRLVPDTYCYIDGNTEQGWWDDEHWARYGHLLKPYDTFAKWCDAIKERGGMPINYIQSNMPSYDFALAHPQWMIKNDLSKLHLYYDHPAPYVRFDFTDPGFKSYVLEMWKKQKADGIQGIFFDYPGSAWIPAGGFEDSLATTTTAYVNLFRLARAGLGEEACFSERNLGERGAPMLDVTAGLVDYQRTTWDNNRFQAEYMSKCGLRWYKNRVVFNYYQDCKEISKLTPEIRQSLLTMITMTSGQLELATSFSKLTPEMVHDISRIYPMYADVKSPRPIDAFTGHADPRVYDLDLTPGYHVLTLFNPTGKPLEISVSLKADRVEGGLALDPDAKYYAYDFWADRLAGVFSGKDYIARELNSMACAVYALRKVEDHPQVISTDRHILQGWMDMKDLVWNKSKKQLSAVSSVIEGETYRITVALNGMKAIEVLSGAEVEISLQPSPAGDGFREILIRSPKSQDVSWTLKCKK